MKGILAKIEATPIDSPKDGWRNLFQIMKEDGEGLSETRTRTLLNIGISQGVVERRKFTIKLNGKPRKLWHYREKK